MKTINVLLSNLSSSLYQFGYEGENMYTGMRINCIEIFSEYPDATVGLTVQPPQGDIYPATIEKSGVMVVWNLTSADLAYSGAGNAQLTFEENGVIIKSVIFSFSVKNSLMVTGEAPDPVENWIDNANEKLGEVDNAIAGIPGQVNQKVPVAVSAWLDENVDPDTGYVLDKTLLIENAAADALATGIKKAPAIDITNNTESEIMTIADGASSVPMQVEVEVAPVQSGTGDPSPENIRPITGWTGAKVNRTGKNLCYRDSDATSNIYNAGHLIPVHAGDTIYCYGEWTYTSNAYMYGAVFANPDETAKTANIGTYSNMTNGSVKEYTIASDGWFGICYNAGVATYTISKMMISRELITASDYVEPSCNKYTITFPNEAGTVYGGTLTVNKDGSGSLVVDRGTTDFGTKTWTYSSASDETHSPYFYANIPGMEYAATQKNIICDTYKSYTSGYATGTGTAGIIAKTAGNMSIAKGSNGWKYIVVRDDSYTDATTFKTAMSGVQLVYELATPTTYTLTAEQITSILGQNNIWADCGDILSVKYSADTKLYIDNAIANAIANLS